MSVERQRNYSIDEANRLSSLLLGKTICGWQVESMPEYSWPDWVELDFTDGTKVRLSAAGSYEPEGVAIDEVTS